MKNKKSRVLFLTTMFPYPLDGGGKIRAFNNLQALSNEYEIDLVCFSEKQIEREHIEYMKKYCSEIRVIEKIFSNSSSKFIAVKNILKSFITNSPFIIEKFKDSRCLHELKTLTNKYKYKAVFFEHLSISCYKKVFNNTTIVLSQQNCEFMLMKRRYENEKNILKKLYIYLEYVKLKKYEMRICSKFDKVIMLSKEDKDCLLKEGYTKQNITIIPIAVETKVKRKTQYNKNGIKNILFMGTMTWYPNEQGILWFIDNVWKCIKEKNEEMNLYVVGKSPSNELLSRQKIDGVIITGYVNDIYDYIQKCDVCIVPLFIGGGMRVKILESMAKGIPCISTSIGAEGINIIDGENIIIANNDIQFKEAIINLFSYNVREQIVENAYKLINSKYSNNVISNEILKVVES